MLLYTRNNNLNLAMNQEDFDAQFNEERAIFVQLEDQEPLETLELEDILDEEMIELEDLDILNEETEIYD